MRSSLLAHLTGLRRSLARRELQWEDIMALREFAAVAAVMLIATPALAFHCPKDMAAIDAALGKNPQLTEAQMAKVKELRAKGEEQHKAGNHRASVDTLAEAMAILNIKQ